MRPTVYWRVETGRGMPREVEAIIDAIGQQDSTGQWHWPPTPTQGDRVALARRRSGLTLGAASEAAGVSRPLYLRCEAEADRRVVDVYQKMGFVGL